MHPKTHGKVVEIASVPFFLFMKSQIRITQQFANMCNSLNKGEIHKLRTPNVFFNWADGTNKLWVIFCIFHCTVGKHFLILNLI